MYHVIYFLFVMYFERLDMAVSLDKRVVGYIRTHPQCQRSAVQRALALNKTEINQILYALEAKKIIQRTSSNPPLWSLFQKSSSPISINESGELRLSGSVEIKNNTPIDYLEPISLLNFIAAKYSLTFKFDEKQLDEDWEITASLCDPVNVTNDLQSTGNIFESIEMARYSASVKLLTKITYDSNLPYSDIANKFISGLPKELNLPKPKNQLSPSPIQHLSYSETDYYNNYYHDKEIENEDEKIDFQGFNQQESFPIHPNSQPPHAIYDHRRVLYIGEQYGGEEGPFLEFKGARGDIYEYNSFKYSFNSIVWENISAFINLHANGSMMMVPNAKIVFGVSDHGLIQGIKFFKPHNKTKDEILRQKRDEFSRKIVDLAQSMVQPKEITSHVRVHLEEVFLPFDDQSESENFFAILEVIVAIPTFPTICSVRDSFYYHQPNAGSICKMTLQQLHTRFTTPGFRFVS